MSRNVSAAAQQAAFAQETSAVFLILLKLDHPDMSTPIRVVNNTESITSNADVYQPFPFRVRMPDEAEGQIGRVRLTIDNVDQQVVQAIRTATSAPTVTMWIVDGTQPEFAEKYHQARQAAGYLHADRVQDIVNGLEQEQLKPQAARVMLDAYKWSAERMAPKGHSPQVINDHKSSDGSMSPQQEVSDEDLDRRIRELSGGE